ncbi:MAG: hypothetical protein ACE5I1_30180 [bacterium]
MKTNLFGSNYTLMFPEKRFEAAGEQVEKILALSQIELDSVLDICCGPGRHAAAFAKMGKRGRQQLALFGNLDGKPFGPDAERLIGVAWK